MFGFPWTIPKQVPTGEYRLRKFCADCRDKRHRRQKWRFELTLLPEEQARCEVCGSLKTVETCRDYGIGP